MKSPIYPDVEMKQITRHGITIDYCPKSGGVWLDKGELEKLIEFEKGALKNEVYEEDNIPFGGTHKSQNLRGNDKKYSRKHKKKRENPLSEIFDFDFF